MIAFWDGLETRPQVDGAPSASQAFPAAGRSAYTWPALFAPLEGALEPSTDGAELPLQPVAPIWERIADDDGDNAGAGEAGLPRYEHCFQW